MARPAVLTVADTIAKSFLLAVETRGDRPAIREKKFGIWQPTSWRQWLQISKDIAYGLHATGFRPGDVALDFIMVKGKKEPEVIYAIAGREDTAHSGRFQRLRNLTIEVLACYRSRDWDGALEAIERGRKTDEAQALKLLYNLYEARIRGYQENPPPEDWNGAFALLTK